MIFRNAKIIPIGGMKDYDASCAFIENITKFRI